jgi:hypothetical protein
MTVFVVPLNSIRTSVEDFTAALLACGARPSGAFLAASPKA